MKIRALLTWVALATWLTSRDNPYFARAMVPMWSKIAMTRDRSR